MQKFVVVVFGTVLAALIVVGCASDNGSSPQTEVSAETEATAEPEVSAETEATTTEATAEPEASTETPPPALNVVAKHPEFDCLNTTFSMFIDVFGVYVIAPPGAPDAQFLHTANVLAQYLDNDEDGIPDDPEVLRVLTEGNYVVPVWTGTDRESFWEGVRGTPCEDNISMAASMYYDEDEWALGGLPATGSWDGNLEEVWHIVSTGWYQAYPEFFADEPGSQLSNAMDIARGGNFQSIPDSYPEASWYSYDDESCSYPCQIHEYFYWLLMTNIGALDSSISDRCPDVAVEWRVCTKAQLEEVDELAYDLLNQNGFNLPTRIPTGTYLPKD